MKKSKNDSKTMKTIKPLLLIVFVFIISTCSYLIWSTFFTKEKVYKQTRFLMDTYCSIQSIGPKKRTNNAIKMAFERMEEIDRTFNVTNPESPVYGFNRTGNPIVNQEIVSLVQAAVQISEVSNGGFDITIFPLIDLWGFYGDHPSVPEKRKLLATLEHIGYTKLAIDNGVLKKTGKKVEIELGGIAKGYAIGEAARVLKESGIKSALIDAGGDIYVLGKRHNRAWRVGLRNPRGDGVLGTMEVMNKAIVTSGDYERSFEENGVRYHHILNPHTGYPAMGMASVTVISSDPVLADAFSTALFVLGVEEGLALVENTPDVNALMITVEGKAYHSSGLNEEFHFENAPSSKK